jgi:2-polyprenyl-3-methyl-5-hydroxy-6-metoxy-1,4-benzoquinol methylase
MACISKAGFEAGGDKRIFEIGCGKGWVTSQLREFGKVTAFDTAEKTIEENRQVYPDINFEFADATEDLPYNDEFDLAVSTEVLEHIPYEKQQNLIDNAAKALKAGGYFVLTTPNRTVCEKRKLNLFQPIEDVVSEEQLRELFSKDFVVVELYTVIYNLKPRIVDIVWKRICYPINMTIFQGLIKRLNCGQHLVVLAQKKKADNG